MSNYSSPYRARYGYSIREIALKTGVSYQYVYKLLVLGIKPKYFSKKWPMIKELLGDRAEWLPSLEKL